MKFAILTEAYLSNFVYYMPKDKEQLLYDFYMLEFLDKGPDARSSAEQLAGLGRNEEEAKNIEYLMKHTKSRLLPNLANHLLNAIIYAMSREIKHFDDQARLTKKDRDKYWQEFLVVNIDVEEKHSKAQAEAYVKVCEKMFGLRWNQGYGGTAWANICRGWLSLYHSSFEELYIWIDHAYDLCHNNNTVFDKIRSYFKIIPGTQVDSVRWVKEALDFKANLKTPWELYPNCSSDMQKLAAYILRLKGYGEFISNFSLSREKAKLAQYEMEQSIESGNTQEVRRLLKLQTFNLDTLLRLAIYRGQTEVCEFLAKKGVKIYQDILIDVITFVDTTYNLFVTLFALAEKENLNLKNLAAKTVYYKKFKLLDFLIKEGVSIETVIDIMFGHEISNTSLNDPDYIDYLLGKSLTINQLSTLLDANVKLLSMTFDYSAFIPEYYILDRLKKLIEKGADINVDNGITLTYAVAIKNMKFIGWLLDRKDINVNLTLNAFHYLLLAIPDVENKDNMLLLDKLLERGFNTKNITEDTKRLLRSFKSIAEGNTANIKFGPRLKELIATI